MSVDWTVHRLRDLQYLPGAILSLAASETHLAVSRDNGRVELYDSLLRATPYTLQCPAPVTSMIGYEEKAFVGALCEMGSFGVIDFHSNRWSHHTESLGGAIFDICGLPGTHCIAIACQDGGIRIFSLPRDTTNGDDPPLELMHTLPSATAAVQSLACYRSSGNDDFEGLELYAGVVDGTIRHYKKSKSAWRCQQRMTVECRGRSVPTQLWTLDVTTDGTLVSGDSLGQVQFWRNGIWLGSVEQNDNQADVLSVLAVGDSQVFASGVDARVVSIQRDSEHKWVVSQAQRPHTHDVMAMALIRGSKTLVTAGVDCKLCSYEVAQWGRVRPVVTYPWPSRSPVSIGGRCLVMKRLEQVDLYKLNDAEEGVGFPQIQQGDNQIGTIRVGQPVEHVCLSANAEFLAVQTVYLRLFHISFSKKGVFQPRELGISFDPIQDIVAMKFMDNGNLVVATAGREMIILSLSKEQGEPVRVVASASVEDQATTLPIHSIATFRSEWIATLASEGNPQRAVSIYRFSDSEIVHFWTLPDVGSTITAFTFLQDGTLAVACERFAFYLFDVENRSLTTWSETAGVPLEMPSEIANRRDFPIYIGVNSAAPSVLFLVSFGAIVAVDINSSPPFTYRVIPEKHVRSKKRRRKESQDDENDKMEPDTNCTMCLLYTGILNIDFIGKGEMVVVEQPWLDVVASFPDPLQRHVYGT